MNPKSHSLPAFRLVAGVALVLGILSMVGCASPQPVVQSNTFAVTSAEVGVALANEAGDLLRGTYPPATSEFALRQGEDAFGKRLNAILRRSGYAMVVSDANGRGSHPGDGSVEVSYIVDQPAPGLYRLVVGVGSVQMTRAYVSNAGELRPAGAWSRRIAEGGVEPPAFVPVSRSSKVEFIDEPATPKPLPATVTPVQTATVSTVKPAASLAPSKTEAAQEAPRAAVVTAAVPTPSIATANSSATASTAAPVVAPTSWAVEAEPTLRDVVSRWAAAGGIQLQWESARNLDIGDAMRGTYAGSFKQALGQLAAKFDALDAPLGFRFHENGTVLRVYDLTAAGE